MDETLAPSYTLYKQLLHDTQTILKDRPRSHAFFDFSRISDAHKAYKTWSSQQSKPTQVQMKSFINQALLPIHGSEFSQKEFEQLSKIYGEGVMKVVMIDGNFQRWLHNHGESEQILGTGGACALESIDSRHIDYLRRKKLSEESIRLYVEGIMSRFPSWTQVTGALIPVDGVAVMYDETFPWYLKIKEFGIDNAQTLTQQVYDQIYDHVLRFAKLHNPKNNVIKIPFDCLNLVEGGQLQAWFNEYKQYISEIEDNLGIAHAEYDPANYYKSWVEYTYSGPQILEIVLNLIKKSHKDLYDKYHLENSTIHVRGKQIDHFDVERHNIWIHQAMLSSTFQKSKPYIQLMQSPTHRHAMAKYLWMRDHLLSINSIGSAGMLDFNMMGELAHEMSLIPKISSVQDNLIQDLLDSPLRLHSQNVDEVIHFLERFRNPYAVSFSKQALLTLTELNINLTKMNKKIDILHKYTSYSDFFINLFRSNKENIIKTQSSYKEINAMLQFLIERYRGYNHLLEAILKKNPDLNRHDISLEKVLHQIVVITSVKGKAVIKIENQELLEMWINLMEKYNQNDQKRIDEYQTMKDNIQDELNKSTKLISDNIVKSKSDPLMSSVSILPLVDNIFVSYMQQLLFIPSIQQAYADIVRVSVADEYSKETKEKIIVSIIDSVFEIVVTCITYIMNKEVSYPWQSRFESSYKRPY